MLDSRLKTEIPALQILTRRLPYEHVGREEVLRMLLFPEDIPIEKRRPDMSLVCRRLTTVCLCGRSLSLRHNRGSKAVSTA